MTSHSSRTEHFGNATLYLGDCLEILPTISRPDALVMDPPYLFRSAGGGHFRKERRCMDKIAEAELDQGFDLSMLSAWRADSIVVFCHNDQLHEILPVLAVEFDRYALCFWSKTNPMPVANRHYQPDLEIYVHAWRMAAYPQGELADKKRRWDGRNPREDIDHPTVKPLPLMEKIVRNVQGRTICDPYMGTGTTGVACLKLGRRFVGIEINEAWFDIACRRLEVSQREAERADLDDGYDAEANMRGCFEAAWAACRAKLAAGEIEPGPAEGGAA